MKVEAKRSKVEVTMTLEEDEAVWLATLVGGFVAGGPGPQTEFARHFHLAVLEAFSKVGAQLPTAKEVWRIHKGKIFAATDKATDTGVTVGGVEIPEPVEGLAPKFT